MTLPTACEKFRTLFGDEEHGSVPIETQLDVALYRDAGLPSPVIIKNCVATAFFGCRLPLEEIAWKCFAEFNPKSFAAAKLRLMRPQTTALIFASGKIVCTGAASERAARFGVTKIYDIVSKILPAGKTALLDVKIENIVGTCFLGYPVSLKDAYRWMRDSGDVTCMYSPELFPGLRFEIEKWITHTTDNIDAKVLVFEEGNVVITGGKSRSDLLITWRTLRSLMQQFAVCVKVSLLKKNIQKHIFKSNIIYRIQKSQTRMTKTKKKKKEDENRIRLSRVDVAMGDNKVWRGMVKMSSARREKITRSTVPGRNSL
jgi:transcription initiation factor TFIID TATA-box-binding protein